MSEEGPSGVFQVLDLLGRLDHIKTALQNSLGDSLGDSSGIPGGPQDSLGGAAVLGVLSQLEDNLGSLRSQQTDSSQLEDSFSSQLEESLSSQLEDSFSRKLEDPLSSQPGDSLSSQPTASALTKDREELVSLIFSPEHEWVDYLVVVICSVLFIILLLVVLHCSYRKLLQKYKNLPEGTNRFRNRVWEDTELGKNDKEQTINHV